MRGSSDGCRRRWEGVGEEEQEEKPTTNLPALPLVAEPFIESEQRVLGEGPIGRASRRREPLDIIRVQEIGVEIAQWVPLGRPSRRGSRAGEHKLLLLRLALEHLRGSPRPTALNACAAHLPPY